MLHYMYVVFFLAATNSDESKNVSPPPESNDAKDERPAGLAEHPVAGDNVVSLQKSSPGLDLRTASARANALTDWCCYQSIPSCQKKSSFSVSTCLHFGPVNICSNKS